MTLTVKIDPHFFLHDILAHGGAPKVWLQKVAYKHSADWEWICVTSVTSLPLKTPECFPFCSQIIHQTQCKKRSNVATTLMMMMKWCLMSSDVSWHIREVVTNAEAWFNNSLCPWKPEGSSGQPLRLSHSSWTMSYHKSADVDVYVRAGRKSRVVTEVVLLCARMLHHFEDTIIYQPPQRNEYFFAYLLLCLRTSIKNQVKCGYLPSRWKKVL